MSEPNSNVALQTMSRVLWGIFAIIIAIVVFSFSIVWSESGLDRTAALSALREVLTTIGSSISELVWLFVGLLVLSGIIWFFSSGILDTIQKSRIARLIGKDERPLYVLRLRLARGEITKEQFIELRRLLEER